jgi:hypothetical protein
MVDPLAAGAVQVTEIELPDTVTVGAAGALGALETVTVSKADVADVPVELTAETVKL